MPVTSRYLSAACLAVLTAGSMAGCGSVRSPQIIPQPGIIRDWRNAPPGGQPAVADRRNLRPGDSFDFGQLRLEVLAVAMDTAGAAGRDLVTLRLSAGNSRLEQQVLEGAAFNWDAYHIAVVAVGNPGELGAGLVSLEVGELASLPPAVAAADSAGGAALRLRIPHTITHITLHHTGSPQPLRPGEDPVAKLRGLQSWGASDRNWWDVPYHLLLDLDGRIYEGRDWHYMGETNTTYDPRGHLLISVIGNYEVQEATPAQLAAIADLMVWAVVQFGVPMDRIGGHYNYADTGCPGRHLRRYLEDGTLRRMVAERLAKAAGA